MNNNNNNIGHIINGKVVKNSGKSHNIYNPSTGETIGSVTNASEKIIEKTLNNSLEAFNEWRTFSLSKRASILFDYKMLLEKILKS